MTFEEWKNIHLCDDDVQLIDLCADAYQAGERAGMESAAEWTAPITHVYDPRGNTWKKRAEAAEQKVEELTAERDELAKALVGIKEMK
jgi:hypothetical protein